MFRPMAITVIFALVGSLVLTFTLMPVLASFFMRAREHESETWLIRKVGGFYRPLLGKAVARPLVTAAIAAAVFVSSLVFVPFMGSEFIPRLDEGDITVQAWRLPSIALGESLKSTLQIEKTLLKFPEVTQVVSRTGTPEVATDVMGMELSDIFVKLKPRGEWTTAEQQGRAGGKNVRTAGPRSAGRRLWLYPADRNALQRDDRRRKGRCRAKNLRRRSRSPQGTGRPGGACSLGGARRRGRARRSSRRPAHAQRESGSREDRALRHRRGERACRRRSWRRRQSCRHGIRRPAPFRLGRASQAGRQLEPGWIRVTARGR